MSKMSKAIAVLGVVAGLGVAALPLSSYADEAEAVPGSQEYNQSAQATVQVEVGGAIAISVQGNDDDNSSLVNLGDLKINGIATATPLTVTVKSNAGDGGYDLTIKSATTETALVNSNGAKIPALTDAGKITAGTSAWGYYVGESVDADTEYKGVTADATSIKEGGVTATATSDGDAYKFKDDTKVYFQAAADGNQQEGTYKQTVVFTATVK